jgi:RHH-type proline utilization regulon transcriptional repressor/proline dehydrogenase/delta 1-pyrroline-5-carboxylate dehydrogenase
LAQADGTGITVFAGPVLATGRRELLVLLREQAVSRTMHRFGHVAGTKAGGHPVE